MAYGNNKQTNNIGGGGGGGFTLTGVITFLVDFDGYWE